MLENVPEGADVYIECTGEQEIKGRGTPMKTYNVYTRDHPEDRTTSGRAPSRRDDEDPGPDEPPEESDTPF
jgi:hypothetical protein